jgi:hypothetical protein
MSWLHAAPVSRRGCATWGALDACLGHPEDALP